MKYLIVANWKCNPTTLKEAKKLFNLVKDDLKDVKNIDVVICPPFVYLPPLFEFLSKMRKGQILNLGAQDCFWEEKGAFTGEISPIMLKEFGVKYVIIGHSERRTLHESDEMIGKKCTALLKAGLTPILCVGEPLFIRRKGVKDILRYVRGQLRRSCKFIPEELKEKKMIVAYEPIWAIGTGINLSAYEAERMIKACVGELMLKENFSDVMGIYGGSVNSNNIETYLGKEHIQGFLVGSASLNAKEFTKIVKSVIKKS